ncbi:MAG: succinyldiaminopimelate transaminase [Gammaproteobacteria bacterium]|jgi:N-succinyldiaminopimelate aminotransferase|nr:succinyldiaminopimelate transaminase [Gammaproteobacteria bacterium]
MNPDLGRLQPYPFERLNALKAGVVPAVSRPHIALYIGEPKHPTPGVVAEALLEHLHGLSAYPTTKGSAALRGAAAQWLTRRFSLPPGAVDPERHVLPVNGTREALFAFAQAVVDRARAPAVLMPNPFYQIYEGAALLAGAEPWYVPCSAATGWVPDFDAVPDAVWRRCQLLYLCSPGNPTGAVLDLPALERLIALADRHDFVIASDECYSEIYADESAPPPGLLQAAARLGRTDWRRCVAFHSLSKRSNAPGLRSGFVAGDAAVLERFLLYRTYHGCAMPLPVQAASERAWSDEGHVVANRAAYREKFDAVLAILGDCLEVERPAAGFYLWPRTPLDDTEYARGLYARENVTVLPGSFLSRAAGGINPGADRIRIALVAPLDECTEAARRIRRYTESIR